MATKGYGLVAPEAVPSCIWETSGEDDLTLQAIFALQHSIATYGTCWLTWQVVHEDLYYCRVFEVVERDILQGRILPSSDLGQGRASLPFFFTAKEFEQALSLPTPRHVCVPSVPTEPVPYFVRTPGDDGGDEPVATLDIDVPLLAVNLIASQEQERAAQNGQRQVRMYPCLLFLRAALLAISQQYRRERDGIRRQELDHLRSQLRQALACRDLWLGQHRQYVQVLALNEHQFTLRVGLHRAVFTQAA